MKKKSKTKKPAVPRKAWKKTALDEPLQTSYRAYLERRFNSNQRFSLKEIAESLGTSEAEFSLWLVDEGICSTLNPMSSNLYLNEPFKSKRLQAKGNSWTPKAFYLFHCLYQLYKRVKCDRTGEANPESYFMSDWLESTKNDKALKPNEEA